MRRWSVASAWILLLVLLGACSPPEGPNVILISVDTLRADRLGAYGSDRGLTPNLDAFAEKGLVFEHAFAPTSFTLPSVAALLTGGYPEGIGVDSNYSVLSEKVPTLATHLHKVGYRTGAAIGNYVLRSEMGLAQGFDRYDDSLPEIEASRKIPEATAIHVTDSALSTADALAASDRPLFLWVHYQDPHGPYTPPPGYRERHLARERAEFSGRYELPVARDPFDTRGIPAYQVVDGIREAAYYRAGYDGEVEHVDAEIGRLLAGLRERGLLEAAVIVFTADHGESLGEDGYWFAHGAELSDPLVRIPLILRIPGRPSARRTDVVSLVDVLPTLGPLLGFEWNDASPGRNLLVPGAEASSTHAYMATLGGGVKQRFALVVDGVKYLALYRGGNHWDEELSTIDGEALPRPRGELLRRMREEMDAIVKALPAPPERILLDVPAGLRERLRALGYAEQP